VVGGFMQPQGHVQLMRSLFERGLAPQAALDAPRWRLQGGLRVDVEEGFPAGFEDDLTRRGHEVGPMAPGGAGGAQLIIRDADGFAGASERRQDGFPVGR
jgi:gamma-glutamyltranspeptidase/glutathione hydrolase